MCVSAYKGCCSCGGFGLVASVLEFFCGIRPLYAVPESLYLAELIKFPTYFAIPTSHFLERRFISFFCVGIEVFWLLYERGIGA